MDETKFKRFFLNQCTSTERKEIVHWLMNPNNDALIKQYMQSQWNLIAESISDIGQSDPDVKKMWSFIQKRIQENKNVVAITTEMPNTSLRTKKGQVWYWVAAASVLFFIFSGAIYFFTNSTEKGGLAGDTPGNNTLKQDVAPPKGNRAVITLANGNQIYLDSSGTGLLTKEGDVDVVKNSDGTIEYNGSGASVISFNTLSLPKGSKPVHLLLADGTLVWLNAASSITYPTAFIGVERNVNITGEAYFEVAKNKAMPFHVKHDNLDVTVLGTHFNVNTYDDEKEVKVTLLEGAVNVRERENLAVLKPGQQAKLSSAGKVQVLNDVNIAEVMAWKNEQFYFSGTDIKTIMRQVEKYYDVEVEFKDNIPYQFVAKIPRQVNVSEFLQKLELTNLIHFQIDGKKIIVTK